MRQIARPRVGLAISEWAGKDSNLRRTTPVDLQSTPFGHLGTDPLRVDRLSVLVLGHILLSPRTPEVGPVS
jgi:hypothetical protein